MGHDELRKELFAAVARNTGRDIQLDSLPISHNNPS